ncbi:SVM family protein [Candidatus Phytoplasma asteris]|uniref:SAP19-like protein n=2 Tax=16SrI (Aster yellows group) TaxID=3042590 RepID=A0ABZ3CEL3_9MOLU|nr:MAG: putative secreted protein, SAP19-like [Rapeseed phyllody phytoplasma]
MIKLQKKIKIIYLCLITFIGILFILNDNQVMAMNNNPSSNINNEIIINNMEEFQNLMLLQRNSVQQIINALSNHALEPEILNLLNGHNQIHGQIVNYQQRLLNIQQQMIRNFDNNMTRIQLESECLSLENSMMIAIDETPLHASESQINVLRNIQINIDQKQAQIQNIIQQIRQQQRNNNPNNRRRC